MRILANDFGQNHGFTLYNHDEHGRSLVSWETFYGTDGHARFRTDVYNFLTSNTVFLGERFLFLHENRDRTKIDFTPAEYIGVSKLICADRRVSEEWQNASQACGASAFWGDDKSKSKSGGNAKIKKLGLWQPGKPHAMDSLRHLLYYVSFTLDDDHYVQKLK